MEKFELIKKEARQLFMDAKSSHGWDHVLRVYHLCIKLGEKEGVDMEVLSLAAVLHDICRKEQDESKGEICHAEKGASLAREILKRHNIGEEKTEKIVHCIETHRFRNNKEPKTIEAKILFDADKLDSIGAIGLARAFLFAGECGAVVHDRHIDVEKTESYSNEDSAYREFLVKLRHIKDRMLTGAGKEMAEERHDFMAGFFDRLNKEVDGLL